VKSARGRVTDAAYFAGISAALKASGIHQPCLLLDLERLDANIAVVKSKLAAAGVRLRIVDKSLPCLPLLARIGEAIGTDLFMTFHLPISAAMLQRFPAANLLLGKPMPVAAARDALTSGLLADADRRSRMVWLIDTDQRLASYAALSEDLDVDLSFCFEVDVGLHRGGYPSPDALSRALKVLRGNARLHCRGIMGYEAHIGHVPRLLGGPKKALAKSTRLFRQFTARLDASQKAILNLGGSSTALLYDTRTGANEISMGSAFVLPSDFDVPSLSRLEAAAFIATPILKVVDAQVPGLDGRSSILQKLGLFPRRGCYLYGGKWMAVPVHPLGMRPSKIIGYSTNQQFMALPDDTQAKPDDYAFLRPTQSEFMLQQFGPIAAYAKGEIVARWPVLAPS
jgi:D-serine deaminase-like pyridoxal phosphate-dependent protein